LPSRSLGKSVRLNRPSKKHNSGFGLPPTAGSKINKKKVCDDAFFTAGARLLKIFPLSRVFLKENVRYPI